MAVFIIRFASCEQAITKFLNLKTPTKKECNST
ncbi:hypothetical protein TrispH2_011747 [Trichoplax sp. H2]|nr:hypothetical protein TrispH2_011747 [Trichoplax sp. H2]|eukprot:RDD35951.1 hypothetical protein TrispH2_011747 [Trichoplax sp. H2]